MKSDLPTIHQEVDRTYRRVNLSSEFSREEKRELLNALAKVSGILHRITYTREEFGRY